MSVRERPPPLALSPPPPARRRAFDRERLAVPVAVVLLLAAGGFIGLVQTERARPVPAAPYAAAHVTLTAPLLRALRVAATVGGAGTAGAGQPPAAPTPFPPAPIALDSGWRVQRDVRDVGLADGWGAGGAPARRWRPAGIPDDFNPALTRAAERGQVWWYETTFTGPPEAAGRSWNVAFESVRRHATVFLNGVEIGASDNPYAPFSVPARTLIPGRPNILMVRVDDDRGTSAFPEDWWNWGGIMGPVSLQPVGRVSISDLGVMPALRCKDACGFLRVRGTVENTSAAPIAGRILVRVRAPSGQVLTAAHRFAQLAIGGAEPIAFRIRIRSPQLWSPASPALYAVEVRAVSGGRVEQVQRLNAGMRSVRVRDGILYLNGQRLWLHGAAIHEDMPGQGAALTDADIAAIVADLKALRANITRAHYELSPRLLDALDRAGIMVWAQPPVDHADAKLATPAGRAAALSLLRSTVIADRNHPSVVVDSVGNELSPTPDTTPGTRAYLRAAIRLARALNPAVPVGLDTYCYTNYPPQRIYRQLDVLGISDYFGWYSGPAAHSIASFSQLAPFLELTHRRYPAQAIVVSEWGAEAFYAGAGTTKGTYEFQSGYLRQSYGVFDQLPYLNGQIYWTLRDFAVAPGWTGGATVPFGYSPDGVHHKGLLSYLGVPKPAFLVAQRLFAAAPAYVPAAAAAQARVTGSSAAPQAQVAGSSAPPQTQVAGSAGQARTSVLSGALPPASALGGPLPPT